MGSLVGYVLHSYLPFKDQKTKASRFTEIICSDICVQINLPKFGISLDNT